MPEILVYARLFLGGFFWVFFGLVGFFCGGVFLFVCFSEMGQAFSATGKAANF